MSKVFNPNTGRSRFLAIAGGTVATLVPAVSASSVSAPDPDAALRAMVERWHQLDKECNTPIPGLSEAASDARIDALADRMGDLADEIADTSAQTIAGALLKLKVSMTILAQEPYYAHGRMILTVVEDLERLAGRAVRS